MDDELKGDVDFDFFDAPSGKVTPKSQEMKDDASGSSGRASRGQRHLAVNKDLSESEDYSDSFDSETDSESETESPRQHNVRRIEAKIPVISVDEGTPRITDPDNGRPPNPTPASGRKNRRNSASSAGGVKRSTSKEGNVKERKATNEDSSHHHLGDDSRRRRSQYSRTKSHSESSNSDTDSSYTSYSDASEGDVTDVSPLTSPRNLEKKGKTTTTVHKEVKFSRPISGSSSRTNKSLLNPKSDNIDLTLLMQAVMEMEGDKDILPKARSKKRVQPQHLIPPGPAAHPRKNFSFNNDKVWSIDRENQRLMKEILKNSMKKKMKEPLETPSTSTVKVNRMSSSAINRQRAQNKIEEDNFRLLHRIQSTPPTRDLARDDLLEDYNGQVLFGCSIAAAHPVTGKRPSSGIHRQPERARTRSMSSLKSDSLASLSSEHPRSAVGGNARGRTRPQSAKNPSMKPFQSGAGSARKRPASAKVTSHFGTHKLSEGKPGWETRW